jgi:hypothetical protein
MLPYIESVLNFSEEDLLQPDAIQPVELQHLDEIVERATARSSTEGIDVNTTVITLRSKLVYRQSTS